MDQKFEAILMDYVNDFTQADVYSDWMPDDDEYLVSVKGVKEGSYVDEDTKKTHLWVRVTATIQGNNDPTLNGKDFTLGRVSTQNLPVMKTLAAQMLGVQVNDILKAVKGMHDCVGGLYQVAVTTTYSKKADRNFTNCKILSIVKPAVEASAENTQVEEAAATTS